MKEIEAVPCACGRTHRAVDVRVVIGESAIEELPSVVQGLAGTTATAVFDANTYSFLGERMTSVFGRHGLTLRPVVLGSSQKPFEPNEEAVKTVLDAVAHAPGLVIGVGSGAINDLGKYAAHRRGAPYISVATAPSMDGYTAPISALLVDGVKTTFETKHPSAVVADLQVLIAAPPHLIAAGFGDIVGKLTSLRDWEVAHVLLGEYWCSRVSESVEAMAREILSLAGEIAQRAPHAVRRLMEGLIETGIAVSNAGNSRPTSGSEHLISHFLEMWSLNHHRRPPAHGHAVGLATLLTSEIAQALDLLEPEELPAEAPPVAESIGDVLAGLNLSDVPGNFGVSKFDVDARGRRLALLRDKWGGVRAVLRRIPPPAVLRSALAQTGCPVRFADLGISAQMGHETLLRARYLRERYTILDLAADAGGLPALAERLATEYA